MLAKPNLAVRPVLSYACTLQVFDGPAQVLLYHLINSGASTTSAATDSMQPVESPGHNSWMHSLALLHYSQVSTGPLI